MSCGLNTCHILPPSSKIGRGLFWGVFAGSEGKCTKTDLSTYLFLPGAVFHHNCLKSKFLKIWIVLFKTLIVCVFHSNT